ncbi:DUF2750 domain-containing protein [Aquimonas voraii]|uniref:DUF2750 domain-containing protein n=1 Tax=Aquimonas voraii TaxID=265719 RepID=UPI00115F9BBF|nr:DUF2750 domain-containing protein [Aquimonas voraii]
MQTKRALGQKELQAVLALAGPKRYAHTVKQVADWQQVWGLRDEGGWASAADERGSPAFAIWPHSEYARVCVGGDWSTYSPEPIEVHAFMDGVLRSLVEQKASLAVFPTPSGAVVLVSAAQFEGDLREELARIE